MNLLPLCPNCHLTDQHDPTAPADPGKLALFRRYKDPTILDPQFHPLFERLQFLEQIDGDLGSEFLLNCARELVDFVAALEMGDSYAGKLKNLLLPDRGVFIAALGGGPDPEYERRLRESDLKYCKRLRRNRNTALSLSVGLLRYQPWRHRSESASRRGRGVYHGRRGQVLTIGVPTENMSSAPAELMGAVYAPREYRYSAASVDEASFAIRLATIHG